MDRQLYNTMFRFYHDNQDFKDYVDKCVATYGKDIEDVFNLKITQEYMESLQKGGCNNKSESSEKTEN